MVLNRTIHKSSIKIITRLIRPKVPYQTGPRTCFGYEPHEAVFSEPLPRRASKTDILALLDKAGGLERRRVGRIELRGTQAVVEVPDG